MDDLPFMETIKSESNLQGGGGGNEGIASIGVDESESIMFPEPAVATNTNSQEQESGYDGYDGRPPNIVVEQYSNLGRGIAVEVESCKSHQYSETKRLRLYGDIFQFRNPKQGLFFSLGSKRTVFFSL